MKNTTVGFLCGTATLMVPVKEEEQHVIWICFRAHLSHNLIRIIQPEFMSALIISHEFT